MHYRAVLCHLFVVLLMTSSFPYTAEAEEETCCLKWDKKCIAAAGVAGVGALLLAPYAAGAAGFTAAGVAAGSLAAWMMSTAWTTGVGTGFVSSLQSLGAAGAGAKTAAAVAGLGYAACCSQQGRCPDH